MEGSLFTEIKTDHIDMNGVVHMDGYRTNDPDAVGEIICFIVNGEPYWRNPEFQFDPYVKEILTEFKSVEELKKKHEAIIIEYVSNRLRL
jgi:hypothetical protein